MPSLAILLLLGAASPARAGAPGSAGAAFLKFAAGPRAVGMGEAQAAVAEDAYAAYWNPAGLALVDAAQVAMTYNRSIEGVDHQYLSLAYPSRAGTTFGLNLTRLGMTAFQGYDAAGARTRQVDSSDHALGLAFAHALLRDEAARPRLSLGLNVKGIQERLDTVTARTFAADAGLLAVGRRRPGSRGGVPDPEWRLGLAARNLGPGLTFDRQTAPLPAAYVLGLAFRSRPKGDSMTFSVDQVMSRDERYYAAFGAEYAVFRLLALRLGYRTGQDIGSGFRAGVGFKLKVIELDYAFAPYGDLGQMHRVGLTVRLSGPVEATPAEERALSSVLERGRRLLKEGRYNEALLEFDRALDLDPGNRNAIDGMRNAYERMRK